MHYKNVMQKQILELNNSVFKVSVFGLLAHLFIFLHIHIQIQVQHPPLTCLSLNIYSFALNAILFQFKLLQMNSFEHPCKLLHKPTFFIHYFVM